MGKKFNKTSQIMVVLCTIIFFWIILIYRLLRLMCHRRYLKHITMSQIDAMDGYDFEKYVSILLSSKGIRVSTTPERKDYGADLIIHKGRERIIVQCKLYYHHGVGVGAVQEIHTAIPYYGALSGVVLTNSHFTPSAIALARTSGVQLLGRDMLEYISLPTTTRKDILQIICQNLP